MYILEIRQFFPILCLEMEVNARGLKQCGEGSSAGLLCPRQTFASLGRKSTSCSRNSPGICNYSHLI